MPNRTVAACARCCAARRGAPAEARLAGLLPTPRLPQRACYAELAQARSPREVAMRLFVLGDAHAEALAALTARPRVDLLSSSWRWRACSPSAGDWRPPRRRRTARAAAHAHRPNERAGGARTRGVARRDVDPAAVHRRRAGAGRQALPAPPAPARRAAARGRPGAGVGGTPLARLGDPPGDPARLEVAALVARTSPRCADAAASTRWAARRCNAFLARLAAQSIDIRRLAWGTALGVPCAALRERW